MDCPWSSIQLRNWKKAVLFRLIVPVLGNQQIGEAGDWVGIGSRRHSVIEIRKSSGMFSIEAAAAVVEARLAFTNFPGEFFTGPNCMLFCIA